MVYVVRLLCMLLDCEPRIYVSSCSYVRVLILDREAIYVSSYLSLCVCVCVACDLLCAVVCYLIVNREKKRMMFIYYVFFKLLVMHQMRVCARTPPFAPFN
jgi:hypothetical protein